MRASRLLLLLILAGCGASPSEETGVSESPLSSLSLDTTFDGDGQLYLKTTISTVGLPGGGIAVLDNDRFLKRFLPSGSFDPSVASDPGYVGVRYIGREPCYPMQLAVANGALHMIGTYGATGLCVVRYDANGLVDPTYGAGGTFIVPSPGARRDSVSVAVGPGGKLAIGATHRPPDSGFLPQVGSVVAQVVEVSPSGSLLRDERPPPSAIRVIQNLTYDATGGLLVGGHASNVPGSLPADIPVVARYAGASLDTTFGTQGLVHPDFSTIGHPREGHSCRIAADPQGGSVVDCLLSGLRTVTGLARLDAAGAPDSSFGQAGYVSLSGYQPRFIVDQAHRTVLFVSDEVSNVSLASSTSMIRLLSNGARDPSFGPAGAVALPGCAYAYGCSVRSVVPLPNDAFVITRMSGFNVDSLARIRVQP